LKKERDPTEGISDKEIQ